MSSDSARDSSNTKEAENINIDYIYTPIEQAKKEIWRRWNDKKLRERVEKFSENVPKVFLKEPRVALFRNIATPDYEFQRTLHIARELKLKPIYLEYLRDKFCTRSLDKLYLGKMFFFHCRDKNNNCVISKRKIFDLKKEDGNNFEDITTVTGENLINFHHNLFKPLFPEIEVYDMSDWIKSKGKGAVENYKYFLSLFICHGILVEAFNIYSSEEQKFLNDIVLPSIDILEKTLGVKPMIVRLFTNHEERDRFWYCHPEFLLKEIDKKSKYKI